MCEHDGHLRGKNIPHPVHGRFPRHMSGQRVLQVLWRAVRQPVILFTELSVDTISETWITHQSRLSLTLWRRERLLAIRPP